MGLTIAIPYVGDFDVLQPQASAGSGIGAAVGAAAGTAVPLVGTGVGAAIGSIIDQLSGMVRGRTQTFGFDQSNDYSLQLAQKLKDQAKSKLSSSDFATLAAGYPRFVADYIKSSGWWSQTRANEIATVLTSTKPDYNLSAKSADEQVRVPLWELSMWILTQSDRARPEELPKHFGTHLEAAYSKYFFPNSTVSTDLFPSASSTGTPTAPSVGLTDTEKLLLVGVVVLLVIVTLFLTMGK